MTDDVATINLREGDVYRWRYREPGDDRAYGRYHCCSCIAIVKDGILRDTYWQVGQSISDGKWFSAEAASRLELTHLGNMADLEKVSEHQADYYDDADIVDLNHPNSTRGNFYLRKGAKRSQDKMLTIARQRLAEANSDFHTARRRMAEIGEIIETIAAGNTSGYIPSWR